MEQLAQVQPEIWSPAARFIYPGTKLNMILGLIKLRKLIDVVQLVLGRSTTFRLIIKFGFRSSLATWPHKFRGTKSVQVKSKRIGFRSPIRFNQFFLATYVTIIRLIYVLGHLSDLFRFLYLCHLSG